MAVLGADAGEDAFGAARPFEVDSRALGVRKGAGAGGLDQCLQVLIGDGGFGRHDHLGDDRLRITAGLAGLGEHRSRARYSTAPRRRERHPRLHEDAGAGGVHQRLGRLVLERQLFAWIRVKMEWISHDSWVAWTSSQAGEWPP